MGHTLRSGITAGWGASGDRHVIITSTSYKPNTKPGVIYCPAYGQGAVGLLATGIAEILAQWGYPVVACDLGSSRVGGVPGGASIWGNTDPANASQQWSNDFALAAMDTIDATILPAIGALAGKRLVMGGSAGGIISAKWAHLHPDKVFGLLGVIPVRDLEDVRANDRNSAGFAASINTALGLNGSTAVPDIRNPAKLALTWPAGVPVRDYYSGSDTICIPSLTRKFSDDIVAAGGTAEAIQHNNNNHDFFTGLPFQEAAGWLVARAA